MAQQASPFKLLSETVARDLATQIINRYKVAHGFPALGVGIVLPPTAERIANKAKQTTFRASHQRYCVWKNQYNNLIVVEYFRRISNLRTAQKAYLSAQRALNKLNYRLTVLNNMTITPDNSASIAAQIASVNASILTATTLKNTKHAIFVAAQSLSYTGNGTAL